jgi:transposase
VDPVTLTGEPAQHAQILLASAEGLRPSAITARLGCGVGTVHNAIRAFAAEGIDPRQPPLLP